VNCGAIPAELLESELFGHVRGAFTGAVSDHAGLFETANGGTFLLDEVGELPLPLQVKLLRVLQAGEFRPVGDNRALSVDVRVIAATHRNLADLVARGLFREDLYYRLKVFTLRLPPLRERAEDILPLARQFLELEPGRARRFSPEAERALLAWSWPGNCRELENCVRHGAALAEGAEVTLADLPEELCSATPGPRPASAPTRLVALAAVEREHVLGVLAACAGSQAEAARVLEIGRSTLWRKLDAWRRDGAI
jgi:two-component system response regulator HydG